MLVLKSNGDSAPKSDITDKRGIIVLFFKTQAPVDPSALVHRICNDALENPERKQSRFVKRFAPMMLMGKATVEGLGEVAKAVLAPYFHQPDGPARKVRIRERSN